MAALADGLMVLLIPEAFIILACDWNDVVYCVDCACDALLLTGSAEWVILLVEMDVLLPAVVVATG